MLRLASIAALCLIAMIWATTAMASPHCAAPAAMAEALARQFGETVQVEGRTESGALVQIWANLKTGTWTATVSSQGQTCMVAAGDQYQATQPGKPA